MNIKKLTSLAIAAIASFGFAAANVEAATTPDLMVFKFRAIKPATIDTSTSYAKQFLPSGVDTTLTSRSGVVRYVSSTDVNTTFEHNLVTGDISFNRNFSRYLGSFVPKLPGDDVVASYASRFLTSNKLMPENPAELKVAHIGGLRASSVLKGDVPGPIIDKLKTVTFSRQLEGLPVIGAGSKMIVNIGNGGEVIGVSKRWRELDKPTRVDPAQLLSEKEAIALSKKQILSEFGAKSVIRFVSTQVAYFDNNGQFIQPVFAFQTMVTLADRGVAPIEYVSIVPALRTPVETLNLLAIDAKGLELVQGEGHTIPPAAGKGSD
jgi:hypothetical protein